MAAGYKPKEQEIRCLRIPALLVLQGSGCPSALGFSRDSARLRLGRPLRQRPLRGEHAVDGEVDIHAVQPLGAPGHALQREAKPLRDGPAAPVVDTGADLDPVQAEAAEGIIDHPAAGARHNAAALVGFRQPVADRRRPVQRTQPVMVDHAAQAPVREDPGRNAFAPGPPLAGMFDEGAGVFHGLGAVDPRHPLPQAAPVGVCKQEQFLGVSGLENFELHFAVNPVVEHASDLLG